MAIVIKDGERLYLNSYEYNAARIMSKLAQIVEDNGGKVKYPNFCIISNRNDPTTENAPIKATHTSYISFVLDSIYYYFQIDSNPFFPFYYQKTPVINGKRSKDAYLTETKKEWLFDCFFRPGCADADVVEAANLIFNELQTAKNSEIHRESTRRRVANTYNSGYHYETVYTPERWEAV